jgi:flagellar basal-body rod modification protein FlgD
VKTVVDSVSNSIIDGLRNNPAAQVNTQEESGALGQNDFFALLTQQLSFQDPTKPVENDQMISQMTSFTMADGISSMNTNFADFAASMTSNQALQASSLVGQKVLLPTNTVQSGGGGEPISGAFNTPLSAHNTQMRIEDKSGALIRTVDLGSFEPGKHAFQWDGLDENGSPVAAGEYSISLQASVGNKATAMPVSTYAKVKSVSFGANGAGLTINTNNGSVQMADIEEIGEG